MKRLSLLIALVLSLSLPLCGCMETIRLKDRAIVQAVGVDYEDQKFQLTFQYFVPSGSGGQTAFDASELNNNIIRSEGDTITEAVSEATRKEGKQIFFGSNKIIVIGKAMAEENLKKAVDYFNANHQLHPSVYLMIAEESASKIVTAQISRGIVPASAIEQVADNAMNHRHMNGGRMVDVVSKLETGHDSVDVPMVKLSQQSGKPEVEIDGGALIKKDKMVDTLTEQEIQGIIWFLGKMEDATMTVSLPEKGSAALEILECSSRMKPRLEEGRLVFDVKIRCDSALRELISDEGGDITQEIVPLVQQMQERKIRQLINLALNKTLRGHGADILRLADHVKKYLPNYYNEHRDNLEAMFENSGFNFEIVCNISRMGLEASGN